MPDRELEYVGRSDRDLAGFPEEVQEEVVFALLEACAGRKHPNAKPLQGFSGASVLEIAEDFRTDAYRVVYTLKYPGVVYVLHAFKKKSTRGIAMPKPDREKIDQRLKDAAKLAAQRRRQ